MLREERTGASGRPFDFDVPPLPDEDGARVALHEAALELFTTRGFEHVSSVDLCAHAHLEHAAFDALYTDTAHLFADVYDTIHQEAGSAIVQALDAAPATLLDQLLVGVGTYLHVMLDDPRRILLTAVESTEQGRAFQKKRRDTRTVFAGLIEEMATTYIDRQIVYAGLGHLTTLALTAAMHDLALSWALLPEADRPPIDALVAEGVRLMKAAALAPAL